MKGDQPSSTASSPLSLEKRVDEASDRFEAAWRAGRGPRIEDYLAAAPEPERPDLLRQLLALEIGLRREGGERPTPEEYAPRFPHHAEVVKDVLAAETPSADPGLWRTAPFADPTPALSSMPFASRYEILAEVGRGTMGVVYRGRHKALDKQVAIKVLLPGRSIGRFLREARLLARVSSPHVVTVHDCDILPDGRPMLCMEWVEGRNFLQVLRAEGGPLAEAKALRWMRETCAGMLAAAEQGITHRDLKPSNILIDREGRARVADFGLARGPTSLEDLSGSGGVMGTPYYMAPEQAEDPQSVDTRADIYSFGATFYHALTGQPPFDGATAFSVLYKHKTEPLISPIARNPDISERTSELLERCLAKSPAERFPSFAELLRQLEPTAGVLFPWNEPDDAALADYLARYQRRRDAYLFGDDEPGVLDIYEFPNARALVVVWGNLVEEVVDAVVSSDIEYLPMDAGVALAIRDAGGPQIEEEARRYVRVRPGRAVVTSGGSLPARFVFHGVTMGRLGEEFVLPSRDLISEIMASCFYHADSLGITSIAFPLLGTGAGGFSREVCLDTMFRFLARMLLRGLTCVRVARLVLFGYSGRAGKGARRRARPRGGR
jgi:O-acetyl-ADP-ribose deacetylase (regulator of RNase III)/predicted Ser/Thr protein kinase